MSATDVTGNSGPGPPTPPTKSPSHQPRLNFGGSERRKSKKIGHRRVTQEGTVTYKKKPTSEIQRALQLGIQHHIGSIQQQADRDVLYRDFQTIETVHFPPPGSKTTPAHALSDFRFRTYAPIAFRNFRNRYRLDICDFLNSICSKELRELSNPGASGSIFYITQDDEFIIKTVQHREGEFLRALLPSYCLNLMQHPPTLLPKFHGFYCYQTSRKNIRFVVMNNILPSAVRIHEKYDLKGSTYKRQASEKELAKGSPTLKDLDFRARHPQGIYLEAETYDALIKTIERDCLVLESLQIMDYSLLLGIHNLDQAKRERLEQKAASGETKLPIPPLESTSATTRGGDDLEPQVNHLSERDGNGVSLSTPRLRTQSHFGKSESTTSDKNQTSPGADGEHTVSSAVTTSVEPPHGSADLATRRFQRGVAAVRSVRRLAAYCTALESIAANSKPVQLEYEELDLLPSGGIPARSSNGDRLLLFLGIIDILQSYRVLKKLEHSFKSLAIDAETVSVTNPSFYSQRFQESLSNCVFKSIQSPLKQGTVKRVSNHAITLASVDERLPKRSVLPRPASSSTLLLSSKASPSPLATHSFTPSSGQLSKSTIMLRQSNTTNYHPGSKHRNVAEEDASHSSPCTSSLFDSGWRDCESSTDNSWMDSSYHTNCSKEEYHGDRCYSSSRELECDQNYHILHKHNAYSSDAGRNRDLPRGLMKIYNNAQLSKSTNNLIQPGHRKQWPNYLLNELVQDSDACSSINLDSATSSSDSNGSFPMEVADNDYRNKINLSASITRKSSKLSFVSSTSLSSHNSHIFAGKMKRNKLPPTPPIRPASQGTKSPPRLLDKRTRYKYQSNNPFISGGSHMIEDRSKSADTLRSNQLTPCEVDENASHKRRCDTNASISSQSSPSESLQYFMQPAALRFREKAYDPYGLVHKHKLQLSPDPLSSEVTSPLDSSTSSGNFSTGSMSNVSNSITSSVFPSRSHKTS